MPDTNPENEPTIVERWLEDQQQWQRTVLAYLDSMTKNDDFLVNLGNAMRGSLLAGKPYPTSPPPAAAGAVPAPAPEVETVPDERLDKVLFALHQLQGQIADVQMALDDMRDGRSRSAASPSPAKRRRSPRPKATVPKRRAALKPAATRAAARSIAKARKRKGRS